jgi:hypothetical protein
VGERIVYSVWKWTGWVAVRDHILPAPSVFLGAKRQRKSGWGWVRLSLLTAGLSVMLAPAQTINLAPGHRSLMLNLVSADVEARQLYLKFKKQADACLTDPAQPVVHIQMAGKLESDEAKASSQSSLGDMRKLQALGFAYVGTTNPAYAESAKRITLSWAATNQPMGSPVDDTKLEPLLLAFELTRETYSASERSRVEDWMRSIADREITQVRPTSVTSSNNWQSHRLKVVGLVGFLLQDNRFIQYAIEGYKRQIADNLRADGSSLDFHERDALHYHCYTLEPLLTLAIAARLNGIDLYHYRAPSGSSLPQSVDFLVPYCRGEKQHAEWVHSQVEFDRARADAGEQKFAAGTMFQPQRALRVMELAAFFDDHYLALVRQLSGSHAAQFPTWQCVLNQCRRLGGSQQHQG